MSDKTTEAEPYCTMSQVMQRKAYDVLSRSGIIEIWENAGCRVNIVGSLRMGLIATHRDIDLHVYSADVTTQKSFAVMSVIAQDKSVREIKCINGLNTDEHCIAWHVMYDDNDDQCWQIDIIHIEEGSEYDGYFERMADRIREVATPEQINTILRLKFETPAEKNFHGVDYYEAVIENGISDLKSLADWVKVRRNRDPYYWTP